MNFVTRGRQEVAIIIATACFNGSHPKLVRNFGLKNILFLTNTWFD